MASTSTVKSTSKAIQDFFVKSKYGPALLVAGIMTVFGIMPSILISLVA